MNDELSVDGPPESPLIDGQPFDPLSAAQAGDPFPWLIAAQDEAPIFFIPSLQLWCVTRYDDVMEIIRDASTYSSRNVIDVQLDPEVAHEFPYGHPMAGSMVTSDPPGHTRLRRAIQPAFTPKRVSEHEALVRTLADALIDEFVDLGACDVVNQYSRLLPIQVVTVIAGLPLQSANSFAQWQLDTLSLTSAVRPPTREQRMALSRRAVKFTRWLEEFINERRIRPGDDLTSELALAAGPDGAPLLETHEIVSLLANVLNAGVSTTANAIPMMIFHLLSHPEQWDAVCSDRALIPQAVEESLRFANPVRGVTRTTTREVVLHGITIPQGARIYLHYGSAQRDRRVFKTPDRFDIFRGDVNRHYAFGRGTHMCLGAPLARLEMRVTLEQFIERIPGIRLDDDPLDTWSPNLISPDLQSARLIWEVAVNAT